VDEVADFFLGWTTLDIMGDDDREGAVAAKKPQSSAATE